jgi:hypothetical protein
MENKLFEFITAEGCMGNLVKMEQNIYIYIYIDFAAMHLSLCSFT